MINHSDQPFQVREGDRIAQLILEKIKTLETTLVTKLDKTERGSKGFGSTRIAGISVQDKPVHGERLFLKAQLKIAGKYIEARLLLDSGTTSPILREEFVK